MYRLGVATQLLGLFCSGLLIMGVVGVPLFSSALAAEGTTQPVDLAGEAAHVAGYLLILIVLAALAVHLGRRYRPGLGGDGPIRILDGRNLAPGVGVRLIQVGSQSWLIGITKERVSLLARVAMEDAGEGSDPLRASRTLRASRVPSNDADLAPHSSRPSDGFATANAARADAGIRRVKDGTPLCTSGEGGSGAL